MTCDLHTHSNASDGSFTPAELVSLAEKLNISAVALCDHNTVKGLPEFIKAAENTNVVAVNGIEISTEYNGTELHILGLFLPEEKFDEISAMMERVEYLKEESNRNLVENLRKDGMLIDYDEIKAKYKGAYINRSHIANELIEKGYLTDKSVGFKTILSSEDKYYTPPERLDALKIIRYLDSIGAVPVWAHPFYEGMTVNEIDSFLPIAKAHGLVGMETVYSEYSDETQKIAKMLAEKHEIKQSGGSDFHGTGKKDISLGTGKGNLRIPFEFYENLKK